MEIFTDLTNAEWHHWLLRKTVFQTDRLSYIRTLRVEIRLRPSVRHYFQLADFHANRASLTTSLLQEILSLITRKSDKVFSR